MIAEGHTQKVGCGFVPWLRVHDTLARLRKKCGSVNLIPIGRLYR